MDGIPQNRENYEKVKNEVFCEIERFEYLCEKVQKLTNEMKNIVRFISYSYSMYSKDNKPYDSEFEKIDNCQNLDKCQKTSKPSKSEIPTKKIKVDNLENVEFVRKLNKMIEPQLHEIEKARLWNNRSYETSDQIIRTLKKQGYTEQVIQQAVYNATRDEFWCRQFRSIAKLSRKNRDGVMYVDIFIAINQKNTKISVPRVVR